MYKVFFAICLLFSFSAGAQEISRPDVKRLQGLEDSLKYFSNQMVLDSIPGKRFAADSAFIKLFVKALRTPHSFRYPFDSVITISKIYPSDSSFRIFTWELERDESYYRQQGVIQMKTADGSLKIFPLIDVSDYGASLTDSARNNSNWVGAIYYGIVTKEYKGKKYYTLFGLDDNDFTTTRKWIDILTFDESNRPVFGDRVFDYKEDSLKPAQPAYRFLLEFKKDANARMVYDPEMDMIIFDHLISESNELWKKYTLIPDGDYEGFKWTNGKWVHIDKVFTAKLQDGQAPAPQPVYDDAGNPVKPKPW